MSKTTDDITYVIDYIINDDSLQDWQKEHMLTPLRKDLAREVEEDKINMLEECDFERWHIVRENK